MASVLRVIALVLMGLGLLLGTGGLVWLTYCWKVIEVEKFLHTYGLLMLLSWIMAGLGGNLWAVTRLAYPRAPLTPPRAARPSSPGT